jgi:hypothetical protein
VTNVKPDGCRAARPLPHMLWRNFTRKPLEIFTGLQQRMHHRHQ